MHGALYILLKIFAKAVLQNNLAIVVTAPENISTKSDPAIDKNGTPASVATAFANKVLPVPGGPHSNAP